ncbi:MAG: selenide, water dikinase SelD, partial [Candidatus Aminicenantes bacterium]|nr:selenide, water dikinase SelD [Candidatus Aminicenantes bacterium]
GQKDLDEVLKNLPPVTDPRLLVGSATADDAGVFRLTDEVTVVQTVDVFTPGVDDPYTFGRVAAANSLSDVYAMGGRPVTALSVIGFPVERLPASVMTEILRGGMDGLAEAGTVLLGGHSINDEEVKFGFAVTGVVRAAEVVTNAGARPGDVLVLTKPLGTGIVALASQVGRASPESVEAMTASMVSLNRAAAEVMVRHGATACTDVTGFGLMGHLAQMAIQSRVTAEIWAEALPLLPGVLDYARQGIFSGANERNAEFSAARTEFEDGVGEEMKAVLFDAQTSGGLLVAFPAERAEAALAEMRAAGVSPAAPVGRVIGRSEGKIRVAVKRPGGDSFPKTETVGEEKMSDKAAPQAEGCCAEGSGTPEQAMGMFQDFMGRALRPGAVDVVTKELIAVALALAVHCVPCAKIHLQKAREMGVGEAELEEAAALATAFSGCRAMMLWNELKSETVFPGP